MKIAMISIGMASPLHLSLELSRRLVAAGHQVTYVSQAGIEAMVRAHGHDFVRLSEPPEEPAPPAWSDLARPRRFIGRLRDRRRHRRISILDDEIERVVRRLAPDRLVLDIEMHVPLLKLFRCGIPIVLTMAFFSVYRQPGLPPLHTRLRPASSWLERRRIDLAWWRQRLETLHFEQRQRWARWRRAAFFPAVPIDSFSIDDLRAVARSRGVDLRRETSRREWLRPMAVRRLPVLCLNLAEMDWPQTPPSNLTYVGPKVHRERRDDAVDVASVERWRRFDAERGTDRPLVYASLGSFWAADRALLGRIVAIFDERPEWDLVLGLGRQLDATTFEVPSNVLVLDWAPQVEILQRADAAITHGGVATIGECVRFAVPMLVYSTGFVEQHGNAARVAFHQLGVLAEPEHDSIVDLDRKLSHVLTHPTLRRRLAALREPLLAAERSDLAVRRIESAEVLS